MKLKNALIIDEDKTKEIHVWSAYETKIFIWCFVHKRLKFMSQLLKLNIAPFNNSKISVKHDKSYATNSTRSEICTL